MADWETIRLPRPLPHQRELLDSVASRRAFIGGVGSGKTFAGVMLALRAACRSPGVPGILANATYTLLEDTTLAEWFSLVPSQCYEWHAAKHRLELWNGTTIYCRSTDQALKRIAGINAGWCVFDEAGLARDAKAVKMLAQRIRVGDPRKRFLAIVTSPRGFEWLEEWCGKTRKDGSPAVHVVRATTYDNPHTGEEYKAELEQDFPKGTPEHAQEMGGEFIHRTGLLYGDVFVPARHVVPLSYDYERPYDLGWDPGSRASAQVAIQELRPGLFVVVREWLPTGEWTEDTALRIERDMGKAPRRVYLDTPSKLNTRTGLNDVEALIQAWGRRTDVLVSGGRMRETDYRETSVRTAFNRDALAISSALIREAAGAEDRGLVRALRTMPYKAESTRDEKVDEKDPRRHVLDSLEFAVVQLIPPRFYDPGERRRRLEALRAA